MNYRLAFWLLCSTNLVCSADALPICTRCSGGGARSEFWPAMQADIYQSPLVITNAAEGPAHGVALLAGVGTGVWSSVEQACKASIRSVTKVTPNKKRAAEYDRSFSVYDKLYGDLRARFGEMSGL